MAPPLTCGPGAPKRRLLQAAADGDLQRFKRIASVLDAGKGRLGQTVAAVEDRGAGALHIAAFPGRTALCAYLVEELHQDVNNADESGETPLVYAVRGDTVDTVQYLLDHGANPDKPDANGSTPLHLAAAGGNCEIVKALLSKGADIHSFFGIGSTPLHMAAACKQYNAMKVLLDNHADCNKVTNSVYTPLMAALTSGSLECVKLLVKAARHSPDDATLLSNRSLCWMKRPGWAKACYLQGAAQMLLKDYEKACDACISRWSQTGSSKC
ncbi:hypothetical protein PVAP13_1NG388919 [Panicum virgatum]|uniref:Uncharacterized protein n=1 Tax=Panicum virgatum TaxID=38727 RepID=A0A8T0WT67_PANVG|nr:hypothetical protein PVAP13_1NG388919 [Panicum virgatum]